MGKALVRSAAGDGREGFEVGNGLWGTPWLAINTAHPSLLCATPRARPPTPHQHSSNRLTSLCAT